MSASRPTLRHIVLFGFKPQTNPAEIDEIVRRFSALRHSVPGIAGFEWGTNVSPEGLARGHTHGFTLTFETEAARDAYLPHPEHKAFAEWAGAFVETVLVFDYWTEADR